MSRITDVPGILVGQAEDAALPTGVTVVAGARPMVAGVHVMGGAPGTRETDLLRPDATVPGVDAVVLSGGSAFGLAAATGVAAALARAGRGYDAAGFRVPIVPAAILFDLPLSGGGADYAALGEAAWEALGHEVAEGSVGAGRGATVAGLKGGVGTASAALPSGAVVGAVAAVNALGQATVGEGPQFWAAPFEEAGEFGGLGPSPDPAPPPATKLDGGGATTLAVVATDAALTKAEATRLAVAAHDGLARALVPAHTPLDGDIVFALSTGAREATDHDRLMLGHAAATVLARAIARGVYRATSVAGGPPSWSERFG